MTRCSWAAQMASRNSCRSSLRTSRSPIRGSRARTSSPSATPWRGNAPSSMPSRQTTRCGTERIGTRVHTVSVPVRKLARVGRPARRPRSSAVTSASPSSTSMPAALSATSSSSRRSCMVCQASAASPRLRTSSSRVRAQSRTGRLFAERADGVVDAVDQLGEPADQVDVAAVDVVERQSLVDPGVVVLHGDAEQQPVDRDTPGALPDAAQSIVSAMVRVEAPAGAGGDGPVAQPLEIVVVETEPLRTGPSPARSSTWVAVTRLAASSSSWESRSSSGFVWRRDRSASLTRSRAAGWPPGSSLIPNAAATSGANVSTSGHMIRMSRGSRVGSSSSRPRMTSRTTST